MVRVLSLILVQIPGRMVPDITAGADMMGEAMAAGVMVVEGMEVIEAGGMSFLQPFRLKFPVWADWCALVFMAFAAPLISAFIHSWCVYRSDFRLYNAEIGGAYFHGSHALDNSVVSIILPLTASCGVLGIPTFLALLAFRRRALYRWLVWSGFVVLWTWFYFKMEIAYR